MSRFFKRQSRMSMPVLAAGEPPRFGGSLSKITSSPLTPQIEEAEYAPSRPTSSPAPSRPASLFEQEYFVPYDQPQDPVSLFPVGQVAVEARREVVQVAFTPSDLHVVATVHGTQFDRDGKQANSVFFWDARTLLEGHMAKTDRLKNSEAPKAVGAVAFSNQDVMSCLYPRDLNGDEDYATASTYSKAYRLDAHDLAGTRRLFKSNVAIRAPFAVSPDGLFIAGVTSTGNVSDGRISLLRVNGPTGKAAREPAPTTAVDLLAVHVDEVTHIQFMPNGRELISLSKDGTGRLTSIKNGSTRAKFEVAGRQNPKLLQVSPDGTLVASVWGFDVVLWYPGTGQMTTYNLNTVRRNEGWPLCISPDCRYLACRTEKGIDVLELLTGRALGETKEVQRASCITSGAFNSEGTRIALGTYIGFVEILKIIQAR